MQIAAYFQQIFFSLDYRTLESALKQMPDYLMAAIKVDRVRGLQLMDPLRKVALRGHYDQMKMILHQDITIHFDPVALCAFSVGVSFVFGKNLARNGSTAWIPRSTLNSSETSMRGMVETNLATAAASVETGP